MNFIFLDIKAVTDKCFRVQHLEWFWIHWNFQLRSIIVQIKERAQMSSFVVISLLLSPQITSNTSLSSYIQWCPDKCSSWCVLRWCISIHNGLIHEWNKQQVPFGIYLYIWINEIIMFSSLIGSCYQSVELITIRILHHRMFFRHEAVHL